MESNLWIDSEKWLEGRAETVNWGGRDAWNETSSSLRIVTLTALKQHMRVDFETDDTLILMYGIASEKHVINMTRRSVTELVAENRARTGDTKAGFPPDLYIAIMIYAAQLYASREPVSGLAQYAVPFTLDALVKPWIKL